VSNPPYGHRIGEFGKLRDLYARLGQVARERFGGWRVTLLVPAAPVEHQTGLAFQLCFRTQTGGLQVRAIAAHVPGSPAAGG
jgi:putative N6-adenine-specific DNA methylase